MTHITEDSDFELVCRFNSDISEYYKNVSQEFVERSNDANARNKLKILCEQHQYLKKYGRLRKDTKKEKFNKYCANILYLLNHIAFKDKYNKQEKEFLVEYCIKKIRGLYKHAQSWKTGFCNMQIMKGFSELNTISICIAKNTLEANEQWLERLMKDLDDRYPQIKLNDKIMIINSKKNTLNGNATHCKNINDAWQLLKNPNNAFKIIFMCSNSTRIVDILDICESLLNLKEGSRNIRIFHDEAHNSKEGIPPHRAVIENIIIKPNVISYQPITASKGCIVDIENPLWLSENIEKYAIDFTEFDETKSDNPNYSSIQEANKISIEDLKSNENWTNYNITEVSREEFISVDDKYKDKNLCDLTDDDLIDIDRRRELDFCHFMRLNREVESLNYGYNILNLNDFIGEELFIKNCLNLYVISTPNRKVLTNNLALRALSMSYRPNVLAIYGNQGEKFHLFKHDEQKSVVVDKHMGNGEFNDKIFKLLHYMSSNNIDINRPLIIIGNYIPTGESLSFVNYKYSFFGNTGTIRSVMRLQSTNSEEDYQTACRGNYMITKFIEKIRNWNKPEKFLIGPSSFIENAIDYEIENDNRIDKLKSGEIGNDTKTVIVLPECSNNVNFDNGKKSIPVKINVDLDDERYPRMIEIAKKARRSEDEKSEFMKLLENAINDNASEFSMDDPTGKFDFSKYKINQFRCYQKKSEPPSPGVWKFNNYKIHHETKSGFINNTTAHSLGDCEILTCSDKYILKNDNGETLEKNGKTTWWLSYKY